MRELQSPARGKNFSEDDVYGERRGKRASKKRILARERAAVRDRTLLGDEKTNGSKDGKKSRKKRDLSCPPFLHSLAPRRRENSTATPV